MIRKLNKLSIEDLDLKGIRTLIRADFNVPLDNDGKITDDSRISAGLTTIKKALSDNAKVIVMSHLGRPEGKVNGALSLKTVAARLGELLGKEVQMAPDCIGPDVEKMVANLQNGECLMLENLRFHRGETENDEEFSRQLGRLADVYINNAFGAAHRAHASVAGITRHVKKCAAGFLVQKEINYLAGALNKPTRPFIAIIGGAKISGKIEVISHLLEKVDYLLIGGGMMYTFLKARGHEIGASLLEDDKVSIARETIKKGGDKLILPVDTVVADAVSADAETKIVSVGAIEPGWIGVDIGPKTVRKYYKYIIEAKTIIWNGPMGVFEIDQFAEGTNSLAKAVADSTDGGSVSIIGGGDSAAAVKKANMEDRITHISTGGGAALEMLEGKELPGIAALTNK